MLQRFFLTLLCSMFREQTVRLSDALETLLFRNVIETGHKGLEKNGFYILTKYH